MIWVMLIALLNGTVDSSNEFKTKVACKKAAHKFMNEHKNLTAICVNKKTNEVAL